MRIPLLLCAAALAACASPEAPEPETTLYQVVLDYQQHRANNVTFSDDVAGELRAQAVGAVDWEGLDGEASDERLEALLAEAGLRSRPVGPQAARVVLIEASAKR